MTTLYAVKYPGGSINWKAISSYRPSVIEWVIARHWPRKSWKQLYRKGWRIVKVKLVEIV